MSSSNSETLVYNKILQAEYLSIFTAVAVFAVWVAMAVTLFIGWSAPVIDTAVTTWDVMLKNGRDLEQTYVTFNHVTMLLGFILVGWAVSRAFLNYGWLSVFPHAIIGIIFIFYAVYCNYLLGADIYNPFVFGKEGAAGPLPDPTTLDLYATMDSITGGAAVADLIAKSVVDYHASYRNWSMGVTIVGLLAVGLTVAFLWMGAKRGESKTAPTA